MVRIDKFLPPKILNHTNYGKFIAALGGSHYLAGEFTPVSVRSNIQPGFLCALAKEYNLPLTEETAINICGKVAEFTAQYEYDPTSDGPFVEYVQTLRELAAQPLSKISLDGPSILEVTSE